MLIKILERLAKDTGFDLVTQRASLVELAQNAAIELHKTLDCNRLDREVTLVVPVNKFVSLPSFVGDVKGIRQHNAELLVNYHGINQPRYTSYTWKYQYKNWRDMGESPVHTIPSSQHAVYFLAAGLESPLAEVTITGHSDISINTSETVVVSTTNGPFTVRLFGPEIYSIVSLSRRTYDIQVFEDETDIELAVLYANEQSTSYKIIDVSQLYQPNDTVDASNNPASLIDVGYKVRPTLLQNDADMFYTNNNDYDDAWFNKAMELFCRPLQGREADTAKYAAASLVTGKNDKSSTENSIEKKVVWGRNKYHGLFNRYRSGYSPNYPCPPYN